MICYQTLSISAPTCAVKEDYSCLWIVKIHADFASLVNESIVCICLWRIGLCMHI